MATFDIKRFGEERLEDDEDHEKELLKRLKQKIAAAKKSPVVVQEPKETKVVEKKKSKKKNKRKREASPPVTEQEVGKVAFTSLGHQDRKDHAKVRRVLPKWLANPNIVSMDLADQQMAVGDMTLLDSSILDTLKANGVDYFFPVQRQVIPHLLDTKHQQFFRPSDICVSAPTGSGKTLAFVLPIVQALKSRIVPRVRALVILPVQDLAAQVFKVFRSYSEKSGLRVKLLSGQKSFAQEQNELVLKGLDEDTYHSLADIIVATPGNYLFSIYLLRYFSQPHFPFS